MKPAWKNVARALLPWMVSACALVYVFGYKIDWHAIPDATANANLPLFIAITVFDKIAFFTCWGLLQADAIRRFIEKVPVSEVMAVKGASELVRTANNSLADATFFFGVSQLVRSAGIAEVVAVASIPFVTHFAVLLVQVTIVLPFLAGGLEANRDVTIVAACSWAIVLAATIGVRTGWIRGFLQRLGIGTWIDRVTPRQLLPSFGWFCLFGLFDVAIQGFASRAFGIQIPWIDLFARIPIMYLALMIPSLGNFGTREIAWASLFEDYGARESLYAFALWTNTIFLVMHVIIGALFLSRAFTLVRQVRAARREGQKVPTPILRDAVDS